MSSNDTTNKIEELKKKYQQANQQRTNLPKVNPQSTVQPPKVSLPKPKSNSEDLAIKKAMKDLQSKAIKTIKPPPDDPNIKSAIVTIKVFGVGGGGNSVLKRIVEENNSLDIELVAVNTDAHVLSQMNMGAIKTIQIGEPLTKGRGSGGNVAIGEQAAKNDSERLQNMMLGADMIFITAAMGGGTGTGAAPMIAKLAKELGILTVGVVTKPFSFEGKRKQKIADEGIVKMQSYMDALITVKNDNLLKLEGKGKLSLVDAFKEADTILKQAIKCIAELILTTGLVNVDFADVTTIFTQSQSSDALLGIGKSTTSAIKAVQQAIQSPLIDRSLKGSRGVIFNITGDENLTLYDVNEAAEYIFKQTEDDVNIILGTVIDSTMNGMIQATIIATDFVDSLALKSPAIAVPKSNVTVSQGFNLDTPEFPKSEPKKGLGLELPDFLNSKGKNKK